MLSPIGALLVFLDDMLTGSVDGIIAAVVHYVSTPLIAAAVLFYVIQGFKFANGDTSPMHGFVPQLLRIGVVIWMATNLDTFNYWVRGVFFDGIAAKLTGVVSGTAGGPADSLHATAAALDAIWAQIWAIVGISWLQVGLSVTGVVAALVGALTAFFGGLALAVVALIYFAARFTQAVLICLAPVLIGCAMFDVTKPFFERAVGKCASLILLQVAAVIVLVITLRGDTMFMARATTAILATVGNAALFSQSLQVLIALCVWFMGGAWVMWNVAKIAYSIGGGISMSGPSAYALSAMMGGPSASLPSMPSVSLPPPVSLSMARSELPGGGSGPSLPPPPPPALTHSTRR